MKIVLVEWNDAYEMDSGWHSLEDAKKWNLCLCYSVGYLLSENEKSIVIGADVGVGCDSDVGRVQSIPKGCISDITILKEVDYV